MGVARNYFLYITKELEKDSVRRNCKKLLTRIQFYGSDPMNKKC